MEITLCSNIYRVFALIGKKNVVLGWLAMAVLPIYNCFHPILKKKTEPITEIDDKLKNLVGQMFETMYEADGIGLAANQVGISKSLIVLDVAKSDQDITIPPITMINPVIETFSDERVELQEGCLSVPTFYENVVRPSLIEVRYYDLDMHEHKVEADGILARVMQHEIDHLNGILFFEKLTAIRRTLAKKKLKDIRKGKVIPDYPMINPDGSKVS